LAVTAAALAVALVVPAAQAQCASARIFGTDGGAKTDPKLNIITGPLGAGLDPKDAQNTGGHFGYFWEDGNPGNDSVGGGGVGCPASLWWVVAGPASSRRILNSIASPPCQMDVCPAAGASLNLIAEDQTVDLSSARMIMFQVDETPAAFRWWDMSRVIPGYPGTGNGSVNMELYPTVDVTGSAGPPPGTSVTNSYANLKLNYNGVSGPANTPRPASQGIAFYDIMGHHGAVPPARARGSWNLGVIGQVPYADAAVAGHVVPVPCPNATNSTFLGVGVQFKDGVKSALVGAHTQVACDPNIADPDDKSNKLRPKSRSKASPVR
jgi:hypothetical protein